MKAKRFISTCIAGLFVLSALLTGCSNAASNTDAATGDTATNNTVTEDAAFTYSATGFVHVEGKEVVDPEGNPLEIRGIALGNSVYNNPSNPNKKHHTEESYKELAELGFNSVRFYLNYGIFERDWAPYEYKEEGFEWLDQNIEWAKKYGIGIIFNMHYPQGGYQSGGEGMDLWLDVSNQDRLTALWTAIAERYANEPTVWGYGLVNEPYLPLTESFEATTQLYSDVINRITKAIREVAPNQMIVVEELMAMRDMRNNSYVNKSEYTSELCFPKVEDTNVLYEFHNYAPFDFTHQDASWIENASSDVYYPSDVIGGADYTSYWVSCKTAALEGEENGWKFFKSAPVVRGTNYNLICAALNAQKLGENGVAYFDDIQIIEIDAAGKESVIRTYSFDEDISDFSPWSSDGTGKMTYDKNIGFQNKGCAKIEGTLSDFTASADHLLLEDGHSYYITGYLKTENTDATPRIRLDYANAKNVYLMNKDYLRATLQPYLEFSTKNNVPIYMGEFGVIVFGFNERGGEQWVIDMLDLCREYKIHFNYHTYHETSFGLYRNTDKDYPSYVNEPLYELFKEILNP